MNKRAILQKKRPLGEERALKPNGARLYIRFWREGLETWAAIERYARPIFTAAGHLPEGKTACVVSILVRIGKRAADIFLNATHRPGRHAAAIRFE